jgi:hypothetical protein
MDPQAPNEMMGGAVAKRHETKTQYVPICACLHACVILLSLPACK